MIKNIRTIKRNMMYDNSTECTKRSSKDNISTESNIRNNNISIKKENPSKLNYSKLKFNQNILLNLLKRSSFSANYKLHINTTPTTTNSKIKNPIINNKKLQYKISKSNIKYKNIPGISKLHNLTDNNINNIINSNDNNNYFYYTTPIKSNIQNQTFSTKPGNINLYSNKNNMNISSSRSSTSNKKSITSEIPCSKKLIIAQKINNKKKLYREIYEDINLDTVNQEKKIKLLFPNILNSSSNKIKYKKNNNSKNINENNSTNDSNSTINKWVNSFTSCLKKFGLMNRCSQIDRLLFSVEKPEECFEENVYLEKPGDKYQLFKNQINKQKNKIENMIFDIKLNQKKNDYLMRRYIYKILSERNKNK